MAHSNRVSTAVGLTLDLFVLFFQRVQVLLFHLLGFPQWLELRADESILNRWGWLLRPEFVNKQNNDDQNDEGAHGVYSNSSSWPSFSVSD
jgi:hypothetical protein